MNKSVDVGFTTIDRIVGKVLLIIITLGIYSFWFSISLKKWKTKHTHFIN